jgi:plastocyanin
MAKRQYSALAILAIFLATLAVYPSSSMILPAIPKVHAVTVSVGLSGCAFVTAGCIHSGWNGTTNSPNPTITVHQGDTVTVSLTSADAMTHQFLVDVDRDGASTANCPAVDPCSTPFSSTPISYTFSANFAPGTYTYFCTLHPSAMLGNFVVLAAPPVGGVIVPVDRLALLAPFIGLASIIVAVAAIAILHMTRVRFARKDK